MVYDAIVFDMDGVLLTGYHTDRDLYRRATIEALADFDASVSRLPQELIDPEDANHVRRLCTDVGVPAEAFWAYREHASTVLENDQIEAGGRTAFEDTDVLDSLSEEHRLGIVSNNRHGTVRFVVSLFEWEDVIDVFHGRTPTLEGYDRMKPDPYYLEKALADLGVESDRVLFVGDRRSDVRTGQRVGADVALLVRDGNPPDGETTPTMVLETLRELDELTDKDE